MTDHDSDLSTIWAVRLDRERAKFWRDVITVILLLMGFALGFLAFAGVQYAVCYSRDRDISMVDCLFPVRRGRS